MNNKNILLFHFLNIWGSDLGSFGSPRKRYTKSYSIFYFLFIKLILYL